MRLTLFIFIVFQFHSCQVDDGRSRLIEHFINEIWDQKIYSDECSGDQFHSDGQFLLYMKSVDFQETQSVDTIDFIEHLDFKGLKTQRVKVTSEKLYTLPIDDKTYYMRISPIIHVGNILYQAIWIKGDYYSSGYFYTFDITDKTNYKMISIARTCDNWG